VGGSVRDILLGKQPKDYDFTTQLLPEIVEQKIREFGKKPYLVGKKFGTIGLKLDSNYLEITTMRSEKYLENSRKPAVNFVSELKEDLKRRDFTINSMAMSVDGQIVDYFGGKQDLENKILRCVGVPKERFMEDPLRILRAIRFASSYNLIIETETWKYLCQLKYELFRISKERWVLELDKILGQKNPTRGLELLVKSGVLQVMIPELMPQTNSWDKVYELVSSFENLDARWSALFCNLGFLFVAKDAEKDFSFIVGAEMSLKISNYLKFSNARKSLIFETIKANRN
jgi:tRNA nucleotidyltransferase (CCA-adding enzyme)